MLLHGKFLEVKIWCTRVEVWLKNTRVSVANDAHKFIISQISMRVHRILTSTPNHEATPYDSTVMYSEQRGEISKIQFCR